MYECLYILKLQHILHQNQINLSYGVLPVHLSYIKLKFIDK